jgi:hypothetical protein
VKLGDRVAWIETIVSVYEEGSRRSSKPAQGVVVFLSKTGPRAGVENEITGERTLRMISDLRPI